MPLLVLSIWAYILGESSMPMLQLLLKTLNIFLKIIMYIAIAIAHNLTIDIVEKTVELNSHYCNNSYIVYV